MRNDLLAVVLCLAVVACDRGPADGGAGTRPTGSSVPDRGLVAAWSFDGGSPATVTDNSGHGNIGTLQGAGFAPGRIGTALSMDGGDDGIMTVALSDGLRSTAREITVMGWAWRDALHNVAVVAHGYPTLFLGFHGLQFKWLVSTTDGRKARCYADPKYVASPGRWFHLAAIYDGRTARLFVDGAEICTDRLWRRGEIAMPEGPFTVSGYLDGTGKIVDEITGRIDEVRIFNRALDPAEIQAIFTAEAG